MDRFIGLKLDGRYEITELIGVGGMANVYRGRDIMENRVVAVKILKSELSQDEEFVRRFRNESKAIAVLSHPNIVKIYDVGYEHSLQYIVMEYIDGITLKEYIEQQEKLRWRDCVHFTIQILRALQLAHDKGIVHRDIKPQNVMLLSDGSIKVMDFGIARFSREVENNSGEKTMGSVHYVSPEQASGSRTDERTDIYSVGVMMYEMLTGIKPFDGDTPVEVAIKHMKEDPVPPTAHNPEIYPGIEEIILHAMEKEPSKRYQSPSGMIRDIEAFKQDQSVTFGYLDRRTENKNGQNGGSAAKEKISAAFAAVKAKKSSKPKKQKPVKVIEPEEIPEQEYYEDYDDDYDDEVEVRHNYALPILAAVTCTVIIVASLFVARVILGAFKTTASSTNDYEMPKLVGLNFYEARAQYNNIQLVASEEYNNEYAAGVIVEQEKAEGRIVKIGDTIRVTVSRGTRIVKIPELKNFYYSSAENALDQLGLTSVQIRIASDDIAANQVVRTDPAAGSEVEEGTQVKVFISLGPTTEDTIVPYVVGKDLVTAKYEMEDAYLTAKIQYITSTEERDTVVSQNIEGGSSVARDTVITIFVSDGSGEEETVPEDDPNVPDSVFPSVPSNNTLPDDDDDDTPVPNVPNQDLRSLTLYIDVPETAQNRYFITLTYADTMDEYTSQFTIDAAAGWAGNSFPLELSGSGQVRIDAYARCGIRMKFATYTIDFESGTYTVEYDASAFRYIDIMANS